MITWQKTQHYYLGTGNAPAQYRVQKESTSDGMSWVGYINAKQIAQGATIAICKRFCQLYDDQFPGGAGCGNRKTNPLPKKLDIIKQGKLWAIMGTGFAAIRKGGAFWLDTMGNAISVNSRPPLFSSMGDARAIVDRFYESMEAGRMANPVSNDFDMTIINSHRGGVWAFTTWVQNSHGTVVQTQRGKYPSRIDAINAAYKFINSPKNKATKEGAVIFRRDEKGHDKWLSLSDLYNSAGAITKRGKNPIQEKTTAKWQTPLLVLTRTGKTAVELSTCYDDTNGKTAYTYNGAWGAGSGIFTDDTIKMLRRSFSDKKQYKTIHDVHGIMRGKNPLDIEPFTPAHIAKLKRAWAKAGMPSVVSPEYKKLEDYLRNLPRANLEQIKLAKIKVLSVMARMILEGRGGNPVPEGKLSKLKKATELYENFRDQAGDNVLDVEQPDFSTGLVIGRLSAVEYDTIRAGKREDYRHDFKKSSQPLLCVTADGKTLFTVEGKFLFTERGIVDK